MEKDISSLFEILQKIIDAKKIENLDKAKLLQTIKDEFEKSAQRKTADPSAETLENIVLLCNNLQKLVNDNRGAFNFVNVMQRSDDERNSFINEELPVIQLEWFTGFMEKEVFLLLGWSACDHILKDEFSEIRKFAQKNGWASNKKKIEKTYKSFTAWMAKIAASDKFGMYPYDFALKPIDWNNTHAKTKLTLDADLEILEKIVSKRWPPQLVDSGYFEKKKPDVFYPWSLTTLQNLINSVSDEKSKISANSDLQTIYEWFGVELDFGDLKNQPKKRVVSGAERKDNPMQYWKILNRLKLLIQWI